MISQQKYLLQFLRFAAAYLLFQEKFERTETPKKNAARTRPTSLTEFVARSVNGVRTLRAAGFAATVIIRSTSSTAAAQHGIRLRPAGFAPAAVTNGAGRSA